MTVAMLPYFSTQAAAAAKINVLHVLALIGCGLIVLAALGAWVYSMFLGWRGLQRKVQQTLALKLSSVSNLDTPFQLRVELNGLEKKVRLIWLQDGARLKWTTIQKATYIEEALPAPSPKGKSAPRAKNPKKDAVMQEYQKVNKFANLLASIASTLASLLPGTLKEPFAQFAASIRKEQQAVGKVKADKDRMTSSAKMLDNNVKQLGKQNGKKNGRAGADGAASGGSGVPETLSRRLIAHEIPVVFTRPLEPRETSRCSLIVQPRVPFRALSGDCRIASLPVEQKEYPAFGVLKDRVLRGRVELKAPTFIYMALFGLLCVVSLAVNSAWCLYVVQWLSGL